MGTESVQHCLNLYTVKTFCALTASLNQMHQMNDATFTEFRNRAKHGFDLVQAGGTFGVSRNGSPMADRGPVAAAVPSWKQRRAAPLRVPGAEIARLTGQDRDRPPAGGL
jgi:hypothetical protein